MNTITLKGMAANQGASGLPILFAPDSVTAKRVLEFFAVNIRNTNTRKTYANAVKSFGNWCESRGVVHLGDVEPIFVAGYIEELTERIAAPSVKIHLAAIRMLFDWLVIGQVLPTNPASSVHGPKHVVRKGKTQVISAEETRELLNAIDSDTIIGLRDRALISFLVYTFARVGAAIKMRVEDVFAEGKYTWIRLQEKGGKQHEMPCHHTLEEYLRSYIEESGIADKPRSPLFRTSEGQSGKLTERPMCQSDIYRMIRRRAVAANIRTKIGCHSFRATGITEFLRNGGNLEIAQTMANHESIRTTSLYDRRNDLLTRNEIERIRI